MIITGPAALYIWDPARGWTEIAVVEKFEFEFTRRPVLQPVDDEDGNGDPPG